MKTAVSVVLFILVLLTLASAQSGGNGAKDSTGSVQSQPDQAALVAEGNKLFNDSALGTSGTACSTCHPGMKDLAGIPETFPWKDADGKIAITLPDIVNIMIKMNLRGPGLADDDPKMKALGAYLLTLKKRPVPDASQSAPKTDEELIAEGKKLFSDNTLGVSGLSCSMCHPSMFDLTGIATTFPLTDAQGNVALTIEDMVNIMVRSVEHGAEIPKDSEEMKALVAYLKVFKKED